MKRIIYLISFLVVVFHAGNPGTPVPVQSLEKEEAEILLEEAADRNEEVEFLQDFLLLTSEIKKIEKVIEVGKSDLYQTFTSDEFGLCWNESRQDRRYIFLDINNDAQKDLIVKMSFLCRCCGSAGGEQTHLLVAIKKNGSYESKGMKFLGWMVGEGVIRKGRTLVFHNHIDRLSPSSIDYYHRPKRILINNLAKDSFYDSYNSVDKHVKEYGK